MTINNKTKHHYISKFILKNFSHDDKIYLYRHDRKDSICVSIKDAFTKNNLNTVEDAKGKKYYNLIEDIYDKYFESSAAVSIKKIIKDLTQIPPSGKDFSVDDYVQLLRFCILSNCRTPYSLNEAHHFLKVNTYATVYLKYFFDFGRLDFPSELDIDKSLLFAFLDDFDNATLMLTDLKLTLYYHRLPDTFFIIPDQYAIIESPNNTKFGDPNLKIYFPISSNVVVCLERIDRDFNQAIGELDKEQVDNFNRFFTANSYEVFGCERKEYLDDFVLRYKNEIKPLKKYNPHSNFDDEKMQIKSEIIYKLCINPHNDLYEDVITTYVGKDHQFRILTDRELKEIEQKRKNIFGIKMNKLKL